MYIQQFNPNFGGNSISIQEIDSNENQTLIAYLTGPDLGPKFVHVFSNWNKKIISISTNRMNIEFKSDDGGLGFSDGHGFSANIYFKPVSSKDCESWLDMNKRTFISPNYPKTYYYTDMKCSWLMTVEHNYYITLNFFESYVRYQIEFLLLYEMFFKI